MITFKDGFKLGFGGFMGYLTAKVTIKAILSARKQLKDDE